MKTLIKNKILFPTLLIVIFLSTTAYKNDYFEIAKQIEIFTTLFKEVNMNYVDEVNPADLMTTAIKNMLDDLDPYTKFYNEQDVEAERIKRTGDYTGIGANIRTLKDKLILIEPYKDYPADKAGLKAGDEIIKIDNISIKNYKEDANELLRGASGSTVKITYLRQGKEKTASITRSAIEINAVPYYSMLDAKTGYIVLQKFNAKAAFQTANAIDQLKKQGAAQLILDLRNNPGGLLNEAVKIVNLFVPKNQLVVTTKSKIKKYNKTYYTKQEPLDAKIPLVVIINGKSASASEIVSGALQDLDRAVILGSRSFGKGLVQRPKKLTYGTQLKVTISRYYTPSGRCIQALDYWQRDADGNATRTKKEDYTAFKTKNGRKVFDGGGVLPEVLLENTEKSPIVDAVLDNGLLFNYATQYYYKNPSITIDNFKITDTDFSNFKNYLKENNFSLETKTEKALEKAYKIAEKENLNASISSSYTTLLKDIEAYKIKAIDKNKNQLQNLLTDEIIKRYVYREGLFEYYKTHNHAITKATELLNNPSVYSNYLK